MAYEGVKIRELVDRAVALIAGASPSFSEASCGNRPRFATCY